MPIPTSLRTHIDNAGRISRLPVRYSKKLDLALGLLEEFEADRVYTEAEVNELLLRFVDDFALIRRMLVDLGKLTRDPYGREYVRSQE